MEKKKKKHPQQQGYPNRINRKNKKGQRTKESKST